MQRDHIGALDFYRFIAALAVAALHFQIIADIPAGDAFSKTVANFSLFVDFFFILSGFVIGRTYTDAVGTFRDIAIYLQRRLARIYPLHVLTLGLFIAPAALGLSRTSDNLDWGRVVAELLLVQSWSINSPLPFNFPSWSISAEWFLYLTFPAMVLLRRSLGLWAIAAIAILGFCAIEAMIGFGFVRRPLWNILPGIPAFAAGFLVSQIKRASIKRGQLSGFVTFCCATVAMIAGYDRYVVIALFFVCIALTAMGEDRIFSGSIYRTLGDASYSVYMLHVFVIVVLYERLGRYWLPEGPSAAIPLGLVLIVLSVACFRYFESPARSFMRSPPAESARSTQPT